MAEKRINELEVLINKIAKSEKQKGKKNAEVPTSTTEKLNFRGKNYMKNEGHFIKTGEVGEGSVNQ